MVTATFRFYEELNDFLAPHRRGREFETPCARAATVKHMIEALGVPHTEVELVLVNGVSVGFDRALRQGDRVAVYPKFESLDITPLRHTRFIADAHLGGLARLLRLTGFDTLYDNGFADDDIVTIAAADERIVLTRDRELLKRRSITHGCYVRELRPEQQVREIFGRLDLAGSAKPFTICLDCNAPLHAIGKAEAESRIPPMVRGRYEHFSTCDMCRRVFWKGSHWRRMSRLVDELRMQGRAGSPGSGPLLP